MQQLFEGNRGEIGKVMGNLGRTDLMARGGKKRGRKPTKKGKGKRKTKGKKAKGKRTTKRR